MTTLNEFVEQLKTKIDIADIIGNYTEVSSSGSRLVGLCPFHGEDNPSLVIYKDSQSYYCFGCHQGGDAIAFISDIEGWEFIEIIEYLAQVAGMEIPEEVYSADYQEAKKLREEIIKQNREYYKNLKKNTDAMKYLADRGITKEEIDKFRLGYATQGKEANSIAISIMDTKGHAVGFGYRALEPGEGVPKYRNSLESALFKKRSLLYGLNLVRKSIKEHKYVILVEGYFDVISLQRMGLPAVGIMGTTISKEQAELIKKYTDTAMLFLDGDSPGVRAVHNSISILRDNNIIVKVIEPLNNMDPDEMVKHMGETIVGYIKSNACMAGQYMVSGILKKYQSQVTEANLRVLNELKEMLNSITTDAERMIYIQQVAASLHIPVDTVIRAVR